MALKSGRTGVRNDQVDFYGRVKGGSGGEYTAGEGIVIAENEISIDEQVVVVKGDLQDYATIEMLDDYATKTDLDDKQNTIVDSDEIVVDSEEDKLLLAQAVSNKLARALVTPTQTPTADKLVGVDTSNAQEMIGIGDGLEIDNGVLKATATYQITALSETTDSISITISEV